MNYLMQFLEFEDVKAVPEEQRTTFLFGYRDRLLDEARENEWFRQNVYEVRIAISDLFYAFGGPHLEFAAVQFLLLESPDELLNYCRNRSEKEIAKERARQDHWTGYRIISEEELTSDQIASIRAATKTGFKVGLPTHTSITSLLYARKRDNRPIYVEGALTQDLVYQLEYLFALRSDLRAKTYWLNWQADTVEFQPIDAVLEASSVEHAIISPAQIERFRTFVYLEPMVGQVYSGQVDRVNDGGLWVRLSPRYVGLIYTREMEESFEVGQTVSVKCMRIDERGRIFLELAEKTAVSNALRIEA